MRMRRIGWEFFSVPTMQFRPYTPCVCRFCQNASVAKLPMPFHWLLAERVWHRFILSAIRIGCCFLWLASGLLGVAFWQCPMHCLQVQLPLIKWGFQWAFLISLSHFRKLSVAFLVDSS